MSPLCRPSLAVKSAVFCSLFAVQAAMSAQLKVLWDDNSSTETGFRVERSTDGVNYGLAGNTSANATSYTDDNLAPATTYWYRVCAFDGVQVSAYSNPTSATTPTSALPPPPPPPTTDPVVSRLSRISVQAVSAPWGSAAFTLTFDVSSSLKNILLRAIGPGLNAYTSASTLIDPKLSLLAGSSTIASNDNWGGQANLVAAFQQVGASPLKNTSKDAALLASLAPASYSVNVLGQKAGLALVELFDADAKAPISGRITKASARANVGTGETVFVAGFTITGDTSLHLLLRAIGPSLTGLQGILQNPRLQLYRGTTLINENDDWGGGSALKTVFSTVGASSLSITSRDAALDVLLAPGSYTAVITGVNATTGLARFEAFVIP
ncbi:MAG: fibronectin type III domain-containing protein [Opitutus sp.]